MTALLAFFCDRCGRPFETARIRLVCPPCLYATHPLRVLLGATRSGVPA